jgi:hypothetical protein
MEIATIEQARELLREGNGIKVYDSDNIFFFRERQYRSGVITDKGFAVCRAPASFSGPLKKIKIEVISKEKMEELLDKSYLP